MDPFNLTTSTKTDPIDYTIIKHTQNRRRKKPVVASTQADRTTKRRPRASRVHTCECGRTYTYRERQKRHQEDHICGASICQYLGCGKIFYKPDLFQIHQLREHTNPGKDPARFNVSKKTPVEENAQIKDRTFLPGVTFRGSTLPDPIDEVYAVKGLTSPAEQRKGPRTKDAIDLLSAKSSANMHHWGYPKLKTSTSMDYGLDTLPTVSKTVLTPAMREKIIPFTPRHPKEYCFQRTMSEDGTTVHSRIHGTRFLAIKGSCSTLPQSKRFLNSTRNSTVLAPSIPIPRQQTRLDV